MKKRIALMLAAGGTAIAMVPMFAAFEAHVINVTATIENALSVNTTSIDFGTAFPQEKLDKTFDVTLSESFIREPRVDDVEYMIRQKPKCMRNATTTELLSLPQFGLVTEDANGKFVCEDALHYTKLPVLCPYLSKHEVTTDGTEHENDHGINAFHGLPGPWTASTTIATQALGRLAKSAQDIADIWDIDFRVPCFRGSCAQDWKKFVQTESGSSTINYLDYTLDPKDEHKLFGCDLWLEVRGISTSTHASLTVIKHVVNLPSDPQGPQANAFTMHVAGQNPSQTSFPGAETPGTTISIDPGAYNVTEDIPVGTNYSQSSSPDCTGTIAAGDSKTCTITNTEEGTESPLPIE